MSSPIITYVMSGGIGSRLWPISRKSKPKQFHPIIGNTTFLFHTLAMLRSVKDLRENLCILASQEHAQHVYKELENIDDPKPLVIFEPFIKNTAATVCLSAIHSLSYFGDSLILVVPVDHYIENAQAFWKTIERGVHAAREGYIVLFGVEAFTPEVEYGYILAGEEKEQGFLINSFIEKPRKEEAEGYIATKAAYWNTGIFLFQASVMENLFQTIQPEIFSLLQQSFYNRIKNSQGCELSKQFYAGIPSISFDYAIMQACKKSFLIPAGFAWKDCGNWNSLRKNNSNKEGNVSIGDVVSIECCDTYLRSEDRLLCVAGMQNTLVVSTKDVVFVCPVSETYRVKEMVFFLDQNKRKEIECFFPSSLNQKDFWDFRIKDWLFNQALPIWAEKGVDLRYGGFYEALDFSFQPVFKAKRIRTLARQIYTFSLAKMIGWEGPSFTIVEGSLSFIMEKAWSCNGGLVHSLTPTGEVEDAQENSYDHACFLFALGYAHLAGHRDAFFLAEKTLAFIDEKLAIGSKKGWVDFLGQKNSIRSQNSHMHLLEAFLLWFSITKDVSYLERASIIVSLFSDYFFDSSTWTINEFFTTNVEEQGNFDRNWVEPGHHFEWVHLLLDFSKQQQHSENLFFDAQKLYTFAVGRGLHPLTGLAYSAVSEYGRPLNTMARSWPQAERIKALVALYENGDVHLGGDIHQCLYNLFSKHIDCAPAGLWLDRINERGENTSKEVPASIFYHLISAMKAYLDLSIEEKDQKTL